MDLKKMIEEKKENEFFIFEDNEWWWIDRFIVYWKVSEFSKIYCKLEWYYNEMNTGRETFYEDLEGICKNNDIIIKPFEDVFWIETIHSMWN